MMLMLLNLNNGIICWDSPKLKLKFSKCTPRRKGDNLSLRVKPLLSGSCGLAVAALLSVSAVAAIPQPPEETLSNIPQTLSGDCSLSTNDKSCKRIKIQRPKSRKAESCTIKCVTTCIRGGEGSPGEGPLNIIKPLVVFKQGFRSRQYCLVECSDICNLIEDGKDRP